VRGSLLKNFSFLTISNILLPIASMALVIAISRLGGVEMLGSYSFLITFFFIGQTCATAGLHIILTREIARERHRAGVYFASASAIGALAVLVLWAALLPPFMWSVPGGDLRLALVIMAVALAPTALQTFGESVLLAFEHAEDFVVIGLAESVLRTAVATGLVCVGYGIVAIAATFLLCRAAAAVAIVIAIRRRGVDLALQIDRSHFRALVREIPVVGAIPIVNAFYWRTDTLMLTWMRGMADVGYYGVSTRLLDVTRSLPQAYARALYPVLSRLRYEQPAEFNRLARQSLTWVLAATIPLSLLMCGLAPWIVTVLFGAHMSPAVTGLQIIAWVMVPYALTNTLAQILFATGNQAFDLRVNLISTVANIVLNLLLIPRLGFVGASVAAVCSMCLHVLLQYTYVRRIVYDPHVLGTFARIGGAGTAALAVLLLVRAYHPFLAAVSGLALYIAALSATGILRSDHVHWVVRRAAELSERWSAAAAVGDGSVTPAHRREPTPKET
jgi:O-antigen/teichoic acid export membrane protein